MSKKYKIEVEPCINGWLATLYIRKYFFFWFVKLSEVTEFAYDPTVLFWQRQYNIPDKQVTFILPDKKP